MSRPVARMPKEIYVTIEDHDILGYERLADAVEGDGPTTVGVYVLKETVTRKKVVVPA